MEFLIVHTRNRKAQKHFYETFLKKYAEPEARPMGRSSYRERSESPDSDILVAQLSPNVWLLDGNGLALAYAYKEELLGEKENGLPGIAIYAASAVQQHDVPEKIKDICEWKIKEENKYKPIPNKGELKNLKLEFKEITWKEDKHKEELR